MLVLALQFVVLQYRSNNQYLRKTRDSLYDRSEKAQEAPQNPSETDYVGVVKEIVDRVQDPRALENQNAFNFRRFRDGKRTYGGEPAGTDGDVWVEEVENAVASYSILDYEDDSALFTNYAASEENGEYDHTQTHHRERQLGE